MPWKECSVMEERMRFVLRRLDGEAMNDLCREFGISRKTVYKIFERYEQHVTHVSGPDKQGNWRATPDEDEHYIYAVALR